MKASDIVLDGWMDGWIDGWTADFPCWVLAENQTTEAHCDGESPQ